MSTESEIIPFEALSLKAHCSKDLLGALGEVSVRQIAYGRNEGSRLYSSTNKYDKELASRMNIFIDELSEFLNGDEVEEYPHSAKPEDLRDSMVLGGFMFAFDRAQTISLKTPISPDQKTSIEKWIRGALLGYKASIAFGIPMSETDQGIRSRLQLAVSNAQVQP